MKCTCGGYVNPGACEMSRAHRKVLFEPGSRRNENRLRFEVTKFRSTNIFDIFDVVVVDSCIVMADVVDITAEKVVRFDGQTIDMFARQKGSL